MPADFAAVPAGLDEPVRAGAQERVSGDVEAVTGRIPRALRDVLRESVDPAVGALGR